MFSLLKLKFQRNLVYEKSHFGVDFSEISAVAPAGLYFFLGGGGGRRNPLKMLLTSNTHC